MDLPLNVDVQCSDGPGGQSTKIVLNQDTQQVTHLVVKLKDGLGNEVMAPLGLVSQSTSEEIRLRCTKDELAQCEPFVKVEYIGEGDPAAAYQTLGASSTWSAYQVDSLDGTMLDVYNAFFVQVEQIPEGSLAIQHGARVEATDGAVGKVDEFQVDPATNALTHLVMREGHLWRRREVAIPVAQVERLEADAVHLKLDKAAVEALPDVKDQRA